jgi:hypothetical protein
VQKGADSLYNDNYNRDRENTIKNDNVQKQQMGPGGFPPQPGMPPQFRMEDQPRTAPPNFIPEAPRMEGRQFGETDDRTGFGIEFGPGGGRFDRFGRRPNLRGCLFRFTYIWLINGNNFWFYPTFIDRQFVMGFRWRRNRWEFDRINLRRILFFRCF